MGWVFPTYTKSTRRENNPKGVLRIEGKCLPCVVWVVDENVITI
jgi:hypothetical protein